MKSARMIGNYALKKADSMGILREDINKTLGFTDHETDAFFCGRLLLTYEQLTDLSALLKTSVENLIQGDEREYSETIVHCMNDFDDENNREIILDIIDDYMDIWDSLKSKEEK